jgi:uracil-DNA glycosylase
MGLGELHASRADALAALSWLVEAGVDTLVDEAPRDWLAEPKPAAPASAPARKPTPSPATTRDASDIERLIADADSTAALYDAAKRLRAKPIFADGEPSSGVMIVGQDAAPDDDRTGKPFSGPSGALLDRMLAAIGRDRTSVYLTNLYLWRSVGGRQPTEDETRLSTLILRRHIELVRPRALLVMGDKPSKALFDTDAGITRLRGRWIDLEFGGRAAW